MLADVDPANAVAETDETDNLFPSSGTPLALDVRTTSTFAVTVRAGACRASTGCRATSPTPTRTASSPRRCGCTRWPRTTPICACALTTRRARAGAGNSNPPGPQILSEVRCARARRRQLALLLRRRQSQLQQRHRRHRVRRGRPAALGWDKTGADQVAAHEWGHNWGRQPCALRQLPATRIRTIPTPTAPSASTGFDVAGADHQAAHLHGPHGLLQQRVDQRLHLRRACWTTAARTPTSTSALRRRRCSRACSSGDASRTASRCSSRPSRSSPGRSCRSTGPVHRRGHARRTARGVPRELRARAGGRRSRRGGAVRLRGAAAARPRRTARGHPPRGTRSPDCEHPGVGWCGGSRGPRGGHPPGRGAEWRSAGTHRPTRC